MLLWVTTLLVALASCQAEESDSFTITEEVIFEVTVEDLDGPGMDYKGQFTVGVFGDDVPMTALNFIKLAKGHKKQDAYYSYENTSVHRIVQDFVIQMGDVTNEGGQGAVSVFGDEFDDEDMNIFSHSTPGIVSMANHGPNTNGCQFFILLQKARWLDYKHVIFGKVVQGMDVIRQLGDVPADPETALPNFKIVVSKVTVVGLPKKYDITREQYDTADDL